MDLIFSTGQDLKINLEMHEAFEYGDITTEQYVWITDILTKIYKIIKGDDK